MDVALRYGHTSNFYDYFVWQDIRESDVIIMVVAVLIGMLGMLADLYVAQNRHRYLAPPRLKQPPTDGREQVN